VAQEDQEIGMNKLDNVEFIKDMDRSNMLRFISELPEQCREAYAIGSAVNVNEAAIKINNIVFAGVGGSGIGADLLKVYLGGELKKPVSTCRNYTLPDFVDEATLLFCSSYSGNTEETLSCFEQGLKRKAFMITMGAGGRLKELSLKNNVTHILVPSGYPPRAAVGYMSITLLGVLAKMGLIKDKADDVKDVYSALSDIRDREIGFDVPAEKNIAKQIAIKIHKRYPIIYGTTDTTEAISNRWREQIAENSKSLSSTNALPEMDHNEIAGWRFPERTLKDFKVIMLCDRDDHERTKERIRISSDIIKRSGAEVMVLKRDNGRRLARVYSLMYIGDFVSFYLAILNNIDPTPVEIIDYLKKELGKI
jgi:glucose/mannose-6-phosphate isomerase